MKKFIERIRTKERDERAPIEIKKASAKEDRAQLPSESHGQPAVQTPQDLFWDEYSDLGYC